MSSDKTLAFEAKNVFKHFGETKALDGVTLKAKAGTVFGLLGPNGAGKTTLIRMLSTLLAPTKGSLEVLGINVIEQPNKVRELIGLAGQYAAVDEFQTGRENLYMVGRLYHLSHREAKERAQTILERMHLVKAANRPVKTYSGGMRRRLDVGASLVGHPQLILLDEPTTGLDPQTRLDLWEFIRELVRQGTSILLTTQYLEEADELVDQMAVLNYGKVIAQGTSEQLKNQLGGDIVEFEIHDTKEQQIALRAVNAIAKTKPSVEETGLTISVPVRDGSKSLLAIVEQLSRAGVKPLSISLHRPSLDDVFLALTGEKPKDEAVVATKKTKRSR